MSFKYINERLHCGSVDLSTLADQYGTPLYIYSEAILKHNAEVIKTHFIDQGFKVSYAVKANANPAILRIFKACNIGVDIVSGGELKMALHVGFASADINFAGVGKTIEDLQLALNAGIEHFNVESQFELDQLNSLAERLGKSAAVLLRLNPDIDPQTHPHISTGLKQNKFGMGPDLVRHILHNQQDYPNLTFDGIHCHIGSQIIKSQPFDVLIDYLAEFIAEIETGGVAIKDIDFGGGFGVNYENPFEDILKTTPYLKSFAQKALDKLGQYQLHIQPGRLLVANSAILLSKVLGSKRNGDHKFIIIDGATTELIRPALYDAYHAVYPHLENEHTGFVDIVGPVCESSDILAKDRELPDLAFGDLLAIASAGAYASSMGSTYNMRPLSPEVMVTKDGISQLIRHRQSFDEMISLY